MYILIALVVFFAGVSLANVVITVGLVRRMRGIAGSGRSGAGEVAQPGLQPGSPAPALPHDPESGLDIAVASGAGTLVAFFSTDCSACPLHLPRFREAVGEFAGAAVVVLSGRAPKYEEYRAGIGGARVLEERGETPMGAGALISAFGVHTWPSYFRLTSDGTIAAVGLDALAHEHGRALV